MSQKARDILLTGGTGFLAREMMPELLNLGKVKTLGLTPDADIQADITDPDMTISDPFDWVIHAAGKAHIVPRTKEEEDSFFAVNEQGTKALCSALERVGVPEFFVFISTVAVYGSIPAAQLTEEQQPMPDTAYGQSKWNAEQFLNDWSSKNKVRLGILRLPLIAGSNPPGNLGDMIKAMRSGKYLSINKGQAKRSCVLARDIPSVLPSLFANPGTYHLKHLPDASFHDFETSICQKFPDAKSRGDLPLWLASLIAFFGGWIPGFPLTKARLGKMTESFTVSDEKARRELEWKAQWNPNEIPL